MTLLELLPDDSGKCPSHAPAIRAVQGALEGEGFQCYQSTVAGSGVVWRDGFESPQDRRDQWRLLRSFFGSIVVVLITVTAAVVVAVAVLSAFTSFVSPRRPGQGNSEL